MNTQLTVYQEVTNRIIQALENGVTPWVKPWHNSHQTGNALLPSNAFSGNNYHGINVLLLWIQQCEKSYQSNLWLTYKQAQDLHGHVIAKQKATTIVFFKMLQVKDTKTGEETAVPLLKKHPIFNIEQIEGIEHEKINLPAKPDLHYTDAFYFALKAGAVVKHGGNDAYFSPANDVIQLPPQASFPDPNDYEATVLHELTHWSGAASRLDRKPYSIEPYAFEELVAEMGAAFLDAQLNIPHEKLQHEAYLASWLKCLKSDSKAIFKAAKLAQQASEYLINLQQEEMAS